MLRTRLWMGTILVLLCVGLLAFDQAYAPWFPFLFLTVLALGVGACRELLNLFSEEVRPPAWVCMGGVALVLAANWVPHVSASARSWEPSPWGWVAGVFALVVLAALVREMAVFREPGLVTLRLGLVVFTTAYVGLLPSFLTQLRWLPDPAPYVGWPTGIAALALAIFVPKFCDVGAYFSGRFLGRHRMTPLLSPKKTWEGLAGGLVAAMLTAVAIGVMSGLAHGPTELLGMAGFGLAVGVAGVLGDLAESLIKRDCRKKDASETVPGFGGILDVLDSILFTAPLVFAMMASGRR